MKGNHPLVVRWCCRYGISYLDIEQTMANAACPSIIPRSVVGLRNTRREWKAAALTVGNPQSTTLRIDETHVKVRCKWTYLRRAIDKLGNTIDFYISPTQNAKTAKRFLRQALNGLKDWDKPKVIKMDKAPTYASRSRN